MAINTFTGSERFLSNFWPTNFEFAGIIWPSVEHAYQAAKTTDDEAALRILEAKTAGQAKKLGKSVPMRPDWNQIKLRVMEDLVRAKFTQNNTLREQLLATAPHELIEGNYWGDRFWGVCNGYGHNHLGKILMKVRAELTA